VTDEGVRVTFRPSGTEIAVPLGTSLLEAARRAGVQVEAVCGGQGICGKCAARLAGGRVTEATAAEEELLTPRQREAGYVLLCQRQALDDVELDTGPGETAGDRHAKDYCGETAFAVDPFVRKTFHRLDPPSLTDQRADLDRLGLAARVDVELAGRLPTLLRQAAFQVTSVVADDTLIAMEEGDTTGEAFGVAVDVGTTTVAAYLTDLARGRVLASGSAANGQAAYGADVITRITHTMETPDGLTQLQKLVRRTVDEIVVRLLAETGVPSDRVYMVTFVGNTVMTHLLLGITPRHIAATPFSPVFCRPMQGRCAELGLESVPGRAVWRTLPNVAGFVGADTVGVMLATGIHDRPGVWLAVDIGTNGEMVLNCHGRIYTCSTAAGPVFEGASVRQGMRAEPGAVYRVRLGEKADIGVIGDTAARGSCGSGLIDAVAELVRLEAVNKNGRLKKTDLPPGCPAAVRERIVTDGTGTRFVLARDPEVALTQGDISQLQLAKAAIRAGIGILLAEAGVGASDLDGILLAGAFGSNLDPVSRLGIGMLPPIDPARIRAVGNAAGVGAIMALLSREQFALAVDLARRVRHVELSADRRFNSEFAHWLVLEKQPGF